MSAILAPSPRLSPRAVVVTRPRRVVRVSASAEPCKRVKVCVNKECKRAGSNRTVALFEAAAAADASLEVTTQVCLDECGLGPNVQINGDDGPIVNGVKSQADVDAVLAKLAGGEDGAMASSSETIRVGFIGAGIMGVPMAKNLLKAGHGVTIWNRTASACDPVVAEGATLAASAAEACEKSDVIFVMVSDPAAALACAEAAAPGLSAGKGYVDVSTVDEATSTEIAALVRGTGAMFLEAPVSGSKAPAEQGALIFLAAGDRQLYDRVAPHLEVMGKAHFFLGDVGAGANMKLVVNSVMGSMMASFAEGLTLTEKAGLDRETLLEVISLGAINTPMYALKGPNMIKGAFPPAFPLKHQQKDMRLALELGEKLDVTMPVANAANEMYKVAQGKGKDDDDFSAVIVALEK
jgi:glyoxylate/succinic semialdehyde reductase